MAVSWDKGPFLQSRQPGGQRSTGWVLWELVPTGEEGCIAPGPWACPPARLLSPLPSGPEVASPGERSCWAALRFGPVPQWVRDAAHPEGEGTPRGGGPASSRKKEQGGHVPLAKHPGKGLKDREQLVPTPSKAPRLLPENLGHLGGPCSDHTPTGAQLKWSRGGSRSKNSRPIDSTWTWSTSLAPPAPGGPVPWLCTPGQPAGPSCRWPWALSPHKSEPHSGLSSPALLPSFLADSAVRLTLT